VPETIHIRLNPVVRRHLDRLAERRGSSRSEAVRAAIVEATFPAAGVPDEDELLRLLGVAARAGHVPAIRLLLEEYRRDERRKLGGTLRIVDELAGRRRTDRRPGA
jgi:predicted transcriptional regulator